jgi:hypothetical protein
MTDEEARQFRHELTLVHFPALGEWFGSLADPKATWAVWANVLRPYSLEECRSVLQRWSDGTLEPFKHFERERVHLFIRAILERDRSKERAKEVNEETCRPVVGGGGSPVAPALAQAIKMAREGFSQAAIAKFIDESFPTKPEYDQPRFHCAACLDRGVVEIWHPAEVARVASGVKDNPTCFCTVDCNCEASKQDIHKDYKRDVQFDPTRHCRVNGWDSLDSKRQILRKWIDERRKIENHPNYSPDFVDFAVWAFLAAYTTFG